MGQIDWDLLNASTNGDLEKAKWAIENGADVNAKDKDGRTPLHHASFDGHDNIVSLMLEKGADVNAKDDTGFTPLHVASEFGYEAVVSLLLEKGANVDAKDEYGNTPLHWAIMNGLENIVSLLLENGADVNAKCNSGWTPLHWASEYGHESVVSLLLKKGADVNAKSNSGKTSLNDACRSGKVTVVAILLHNGADVSVKDIGGETPLHDACEHGDEAVVSLLLDNGADVNVKNKIGWTPLHYACRSGRVAVVSLLLENGADSTITIFNGKTALQIAQEKNKQNCVAVLEEFAQRQEKKQLESQEVKAQEETKKRHQPQEEVASAKKKKDGSMELELVERSIYNRALAQGNTTLGRIRLMMCGPYGVGKTSIVRSLRGEPFNDEYNSTEGIDAVGRVDKHTLGNDLDFKQASRQWIMKNQSLKSNHVELLFEDSKNRRRQDLQSFVVFPKQSSNSQASNPELEPSQKPEDNGICITIWDFAGQIKYHCMHQMFFRSNCLYLLVLDLQMNGSGRRSSEEEMLLDAQKWLNAIVSSAGPDIGLIVVGTHADAFQSSDAATDRLEGLLKTLKKMVADVEYDNVLRNVKTAVVDNKNDFGISELKTNLYKTAKGLLGDILVPLSWLRLIEKVREELPLKDNEICAPLEKIQNLANTIGIMEKDQLCAALSFFDRVGELTYIRERELSDWVFTEPQLLLNAMKSLLVPATNLEKFLQRKQQRKLEDYGFLENEALKAIWTQYKNQEQLQHLMAAMGLIIEFPDGVAIPCRLPKEPALWDDKPLEKEIVVTTKYSTRLPPSLYGHALAGLLRHHGTPGQELRLLSQTTSCIEIDSSKCFHQNEQAQHTITLRAILQNEQAQHAIALRVCASPESSRTPDETVLVDTLVRTVKVLVSTLHSLERDRFKWMTVESCVQLWCCGNLREFQILESKRMSESDSAEIAPCQDSFLCPEKIRHSLLDAAVDVLSASQKATANVSQIPPEVFLSHTGRDEMAKNFTAHLKDNLDQKKISAFYDIDGINCGENETVEHDRQAKDTQFFETFAHAYGNRVTEDFINSFRVELQGTEETHRALIKQIEESIGGTLDAIQGLQSNLDRSLVLLAFLAKGETIPCPKLVWIDASSLQKAVESPLDDADPKAIDLYFLCEDDCTQSHPEPMTIQATKDCLKRLIPIIKVSLVALKLAGDSRGVLLPVPSIKDLDEQLYFLNKVIGHLEDDKMEKLLAIAETMYSTAEDDLNSNLGDDRVKEVRQLVGESYRELSKRALNELHCKKWQPYMDPLPSLYADAQFRVKWVCKNHSAALHGARFSSSPESRVFVNTVDIAHGDVFCERESRDSFHPGNVRYRRIIKRITGRDEYSSMKKSEKIDLVNHVIDNEIKGRFIETGNDGRHFALTREEVIAKVNESLLPDRS